MTFEYTRAGHFQFGYKNSSTLATRWLGRRESATEVFVARYGRATHRAKSWRDANTQAARHILEQAHEHKLVPVVCCSGGLDSEITLLSFFQAWTDMPPPKRPTLQIATLDFKSAKASSAIQDDTGDKSRGYLNQHDTSYVDKFLQRAKPRELELKFTRHELDIHAFFESSDFIDLADETQVLSPAVLTQIWLCREIQSKNPRALPVIGQGEIHLVRDASAEGTYEPALWSLSETENLCGLYRYFIGRGLPGIPGFFQYTPEQFEVQLRTNPVIHDLISNSRYGKLGTRTSKAEILAFDYPELEPRPKYTGFEKIESLYDERRAYLAARDGASDAKWFKPVFELMDDLRPVAISDARATGAVQFGDWKFAWGRDGKMKSARTSKHDIFASEWTQPDFLNPSASSTAVARMNDGFISSAPLDAAISEFASALRTFVRAQITQENQIAILHEGSPIARIFQCILRQESNASAIDILNVTAPTPAEIARLTLLHGTTDVDLLTRATLLEFAKRSSPKNRILIPILHGRIINAEFDRELNSTLSQARFVWTENEHLATLASAANRIAPNHCVLPWTSSALAEASLALTKRSGWFSQDEPGPSNRSNLEECYAKCLARLEETDSERTLATACERAFAKLRGEIAAALKSTHFAYPPNQVSAYDLTSFQTSSFDLRRAFEEKLPTNLRLVSEDVWLEQVTTKTPELRLGSNLFFQQETSGFSLLQKNIRVYVALIDENSQKEVAFAQVSVLRSAPNGRLRIRGVTTRSGFERKGFATKLLVGIVSHLRANQASHLRSIDRVVVYAAPEIVRAFQAAGFIDDVSRVTRAEESVDTATGQLVAIDRELTPLTLSLGES